MQHKPCVFYFAIVTISLVCVDSLANSVVVERPVVEEIHRTDNKSVAK